MRLRGSMMPARCQHDASMAMAKHGRYSEAPKASNSSVEHMRTAETAVRNHLCFHSVHSFEGALLPSFSELRRRRGRLQ